MDSLIIFNLIIDAVLRRAQGEVERGGSEMSFYANDGLLEGTGAGEVQQDLVCVIDLFAWFGLKEK